MLGGGSPTRLRENAGNDSSHHVKMLASGCACLRVGTTAFGASELRRNRGDYSPVAVAKALGVDLMAENYTLVAGMDFAREVRNSIAEASEDVLGGTRALIQSQLEGLNSAVREIVRGELSRTLESKSARPKPQARMETHRIPSYIPPQVPKGY